MVSRKAVDHCQIGWDAAVEAEGRRERERGRRSAAIANRAANRCPQLGVSQGTVAGSGRRAAGCGHPAA
eukprot:428686-Heterocapsa_arctica.AAC.1